MRNQVLLCVGISIGMLLITESSAAGPLGGSGQPAPTQSSVKKATPDNNAEVSGADNNAEVPGADINWALQDEIDQVATAADEAGANDPFYTGSVVDARNARLLVYRKSSALDDFDLQNYRTLAPAGVSITFEVAPLSAKETESLDRLIIALAPEFKSAGIRISSWGTNFAGGVHVLYLSDGPEIPPSLRERLEIYGPGTVTFQSGAMVGMADRQADTSPFAGGARIHGPNKDGGTGPVQCTSNFAAKSTGNGQYYEMAAWHCYKPTDKRFWAIAGSSAANYIGSVSSTDAVHDVVFIPVANGQQTTPLVYDGDHNNPQQLKAVVGSASPKVGDSVCTSGASLALVCNARFSGNERWTVEDYYTDAISPYIYGFEVYKEGGGAVMAQGDSGGPVFSLTGSNNQYAIARGLMSAARTANAVPCPSWVRPGAACANSGAVTDAAVNASVHSLVLTGFS